MTRFEDSISNHCSNVKPPLVYVNTVMYNIKEWLDPFVNDFHGHTGPHVFLVSRNASLDVVFKYKKWSSTNELWKPDGEGIRMFKVCTDFTTT